MKKIIKIICTIAVIIAFSISIIRIFQIYFSVYFYYTYAIWCEDAEAEYIKSKTGVDARHSVVVCKMSWNRESEEISIIKHFSSIFEKKIDVSNVSYEYIKENNEKGKVVIVITAPYIAFCLFGIIIYFKILLPKFTEN